VVHHITWDELDRYGHRPSFTGVAKYLLQMGFEPHLLLDPILGDKRAFIRLDRSAYALENRSGGVETNREGSACIQVEWFFTPGCVVNGKKYETLADTPMLGLDLVKKLAAEYGVPAVWPLGTPTWYSHRNTTVWKTKAGHYGHSQVPENHHTDPGPMDIRSHSPQEADVTPQDKQDIINGVAAVLGGPRPADHSDPNPKVISNGDILTALENGFDRVVDAIKEVGK
jgi:hypothetical protein